MARWNEQEYATQKEAGLRLRRSQPRISQLIASGELTARRVGRRVLIERASLNRVLARRLGEAELLIAAARGARMSEQVVTDRLSEVYEILHRAGRRTLEAEGTDPDSEATREALDMASEALHNVGLVPALLCGPVQYFTECEGVEEG